MLSKNIVSKYALLRQRLTLCRFTMLRSEAPSFESYFDKKHFDFRSLEENIFSWWDARGFFKPSNYATKDCFVLPMPPPNITGHLHMGHAIFVTLQDIISRYKRMKGIPVLWLPGTDHAGIATQIVVENALLSEGLCRDDLGRKEFLKRVWAWKESNGRFIVNQLKRLGASADWTRERFTLEDRMSVAVTEAFVRLHEKGLVYRGEYLVNWSPRLQTAVSDLEVEYVEEQGWLYYFNYVSADGLITIPVATTRPETILGDVAVCVHPADERYSHLIGELLLVPTVVIGDEFVDKNFGSGALKITPAHDANDYAIARRHNLPFINILNKNGSINHIGGEIFGGLDRMTCRDKMWVQLLASNLALRKEPYTHRVARSQRGGEIIEPMLSTQWFVKTEVMAQRAVDAVRHKEIQILPMRFEKTWFNWLENSRDWCISRQLWWGHRLPVYYIHVPGFAPCPEHCEFIVCRSLQEAESQVKEKFGDSMTVTQETDVLDTWFSSGLWPFATVGWPAGAEPVVDGVSPTTDQLEYSRFYPATVLETGYDILFFWVARMVMLGLELTNTVPFRTVYLHGLIRDASGQKMSKSKGNVVDPLDVVDEYGSDALRFTLATGTSPGQDFSLSMERIEHSRNFINKLWNVGKFVSHMDSHDLKDFQLVLTTANELPLFERYIVSRCHQVMANVTNCLEEFRFGEAGVLIQDFLWDEFADWYVEICKIRAKSVDLKVARDSRCVLKYVWDVSLRLAHPFMPFLTETLWQQHYSLHKANLPESSIMITQWPEGNGTTSHLFEDVIAINFCEKLKRLICAIRNARTEHKIPVSDMLGLVVHVPEVLREVFTKESDAFCKLARVDKNRLQIVTSKSDMGHLDDSCVRVIVDDDVEAIISFKGVIKPEKELERMHRQKEKLLKEIETLETRTLNKAFLERASPVVVQNTLRDLDSLRQQVGIVQNEIESNKYSK